MSPWILTSLPTYGDLLSATNSPAQRCGIQHHLAEEAKVRAIGFSMPSIPLRIRGVHRGNSLARVFQLIFGVSTGRLDVIRHLLILQNHRTPQIDLSAIFESPRVTTEHSPFQNAISNDEDRLQIGYIAHSCQSISHPKQCYRRHGEQRDLRDRHPDTIGIDNMGRVESKILKSEFGCEA